MAEKKTLHAFLKENKHGGDHYFLAVSDSFRDENGKPMEWEIKQMSAEIAADIMDELQLEPQNLAGGDQDIMNAYADCIVYPDLRDSELQKSYGARTHGELLLKMLDIGEFKNLIAKINEISHLNVSMPDLVKNAKN